MAHLDVSVSSMKGLVVSCIESTGVGRPSRKAAPRHSDLVIERGSEDNTGSSYEGDINEESEEGTTDEGEGEEVKGEEAEENKIKAQADGLNLVCLH